MLTFAEFLSYFNEQSEQDKLFYFVRDRENFTVEMESCDREKLLEVFDSMNLQFDQFSSKFPIFFKV